nr:MAG TPA: hypothetical protein [Caudoviricetes sp.]
MLDLIAKFTSDFRVKQEKSQLTNLIMFNCFY